MKGMIVAFHMVAAPGHLYPTFELATAFRELGATVIYIGDPSGARWVEKANFRFVPAANRPFECDLEPKSRFPFLFSPFKERRKQMDGVAAAGRRLLQELGVTILFLDPLIERGAFAAVGSGATVYSLSVFNYPYWGESVPPIASELGPSRSLVNRLRMTLAWLMAGCEAYGLVKPRRLLGNPRSVVAALSMHARFQALAKQCGRRVRIAWHGPMLDFPRVILGPRELDFACDNETQYLGLCIDQSRLGASQECVGKEGIETVYCTFGTQIRNYNERDLRHAYACVVEVCHRRPDLRMILQTPVPLRERHPPTNLTYVGNVSTMDVLRRVSAAITHGGYGTVKECISAGVPMVVVPFKYDQFGNGARIRELGLGRTCRPGKLTVSKLEAALDWALDPAVKNRVREFAARIKGGSEVREFAKKLLDAAKHKHLTAFSRQPSA